MNKVVTIRLGHYVLTIDEEAASKIAAYTDVLKRKYAAEDGAAEIISDIEERMGELLQKKQMLEKRSYNNIADVDEVIAQMGPIDGGQSSDFSDSFFAEPKRRLFRDPDNSIVAGVWGGVGAYFDLDPMILRVAWILSVMFFGFGIPLYIILWVVMPEARTTADKLMMRGQRPTLQNIEDNLKTEFNGFGERFKNPKVQDRFSQFLKTLVLYFGKFIAVIVKLAFSFVAFVLLSVLIVVLIGVTTNTVYINTYNYVLNGQEGLNAVLSAAGDPFWIKIAILSYLLLTMAYVGLWIFRNANNRDRIRMPRRSVGWASGIALIILIVLAFDGIRSVSHRDERTVYNDVIAVTGDTLTINADILDTEKHGFYTLNMFSDILISPDNQWHIEQRNVSYGKNRHSGATRADAMPRMYEFGNNTLQLSQGAKISNIGLKGLSWVRYTLFVPKGKTVKTGENFHFPENNRTPINGQKRTYTMDSTGMMLGMGANNPRLGLDRELEKLEIDGNFDVQIIPSQSNYVEYVSGPIVDHPEWVTWENGYLELDKDDDWFTDRPSYIKVYCNRVSRIEASNTARIDFRSYTGGNLEISLEGACKASGKLSVDYLDLDISGATSVKFEGKTQQLNLEVSGASEYEGLDMVTQNTHVKCSGASKAFIWATEGAEGKCSGASTLRVKGNPPRSDIEVNGASSYQKI